MAHRSTLPQLAARAGCRSWCLDRLSQMPRTNAAGTKDRRPARRGAMRAGVEELTTRGEEPDSEKNLPATHTGKVLRTPRRVAGLPLRTGKPLHTGNCKYLIFPMSQSPPMFGGPCRDGVTGYAPICRIPALCCVHSALASGDQSLGSQ